MGNRLGIPSCARATFAARAAFALALLAPLSVGLVSGCGGSSKKSAKAGGDTSSFGTGENGEIPRVDASLCDTSGKKVATFDLNEDNTPDVWKLFKTVEEGGTTIEVLTCKQVDLDHDGRKDYVITYDSKGGKLSEEFDFDYDGRFDARHFFDKKTGVVFLVERDSDHDKKPDIWEKYTKEGVLESVKRDRNGDGKPDIWEQYDAGELMAILYDDDFDARVDRKDEVAKPKPPAPPATEGPVDEDTGAADTGADTGAADDAEG